MNTAVRDLEEAFFKANSTWFNDICSKDLSNRPIYSVLNTHYLDMILPQVAQARYMSSSMLTFALLRDSSDLHIYKDLFGERNKPEKKRKITVELQ